MVHKSGPKDVMEASRGSNPTGVSGGNPGRSLPQKPIAGPEHPGQPIAMKRALTKKPIRGTATGAAGTLR
jgi:hypothetical protein